MLPVLIPQWLALASLLTTTLLLYPSIRTILFFLHHHLLHRSALPRYLLSSNSYALITGASGGIGRSLAKELIERGFNVVLHGRSLKNLQEVQRELDALGTGREVRLWVRDAAAPWEPVGDAFDKLEITVLVNCVGGTEPPTVLFDQQDPAYLAGVVNTNALFPFHLTGALLPQLRLLPRALVLFIGSKAGEFPAPRLAGYCSSKAFLELFARCMDADERLSAHSGVSVQFLQTGRVRTKSHLFEKGWDVPSADEYARAALHAVGVGRWKVHPYWGHGLMGGAMTLVSAGFVERKIWSMNMSLEEKRE
ncbi:NAD(P)-binding protein [Calocera viscosa TUFC12733]|uniref:NAD(P)-binding protein n=1 Tax=Calocera viscosa (strain TUFC12733) TaxID=1330018 RepID=A0A167INQ1_CALVF|nr:NAD(P)-binding protein [Calocera viscosa TUFC12733]